MVWIITLLLSLNRRRRTILAQEKKTVFPASGAIWEKNMELFSGELGTLSCGDLKARGVSRITKLWMLLLQRANADGL